MNYIIPLLLLALAACSGAQTPPAVQPVEVRTIQIARPAPIVPQIDQLRLRTVTWRILTPENVEEYFNQLQEDRVFFAITTSGYEALSLNLSDLRSLIEQQQVVIALYRQSYER
jgi:hypothetical protein